MGKCKKSRRRPTCALNNVTGSFNPYGFQDDEVKTGFRMTRFLRLLRRFAPRNDVCSFLVAGLLCSSQ